VVEISGRICGFLQSLSVSQRLQIFYQGLYVLCFLCGLSVAGVCSDEFSQTSQYSARLFSFGTLVVDTRMGDIQIEGWDEPRVEIEAEKVVRAKSQEKAGALYQQVGVQLEGGDKQVRLRTLYPSRSLWKPFRGESQLSVNFRIKMPYDANIALKCVDGDVRVFGIVGRQQLNVNYGDVEINVPSVYQLRSLDAHAFLGYVQSDLRGLDEDGAGFHQSLSFWNPGGKQEISVRVRLGGVFVYGTGD
jgi:hypothetical protein